VAHPGIASDIGDLQPFEAKAQEAGARRRQNFFTRLVRTAAHAFRWRFFARGHFLAIDTHVDITIIYTNVDDRLKRAGGKVIVKRHPITALRALRRLVRNPEDTAQVFIIMRALSGDAIQNGSARFSRTTTGAALLKDPHDLVPVLSDRAHLALLPDGSVGRTYLDLVERAGINAQELVDVSEEVADEYSTLTPDEVVYARRLRDAHDLWHTVTGYSTDTLGEVCVVAFSYAQTRNLGFAAIALIGALKIARETREPGVLRAAWQAYRDGCRAAWLPAVAWEDALTQPVAEVRRTLRIAPPSRYRSLRENFTAAVGQAA
jgi:ubiquinone biosynthesis protein COQ4